MSITYPTVPADKFTIQSSSLPFCDEETCFCVGGYLIPDIERLSFHPENRTTVVRWTDGTKTVVRCGEGETWSEYSAFVAAVAKKVFGSTSAIRKAIDFYDVKRQAERKEAQRLKERKNEEEQCTEARAAGRAGALRGVGAAVHRGAAVLRGVLRVHGCQLRLHHR